MLKSLEKLSLCIFGLFGLYFGKDYPIVRDICPIVVACVIVELIKDSHISELLVDTLVIILLKLLTNFIQPILLDYVPWIWLYKLIVMDEFTFFFPGIIAVLFAFFASTPVTLRMTDNSKKEKKEEIEEI